MSKAATPSLQPPTAVEYRNLRIPNREVPGQIAPQALLQSPGGQGVPDVQLLRQLMQAFAPEGQQPGVPTIDRSQPSAPTPAGSPFSSAGAAIGGGGIGFGSQRATDTTNPYQSAGAAIGSAPSPSSPSQSFAPAPPSNSAGFAGGPHVVPGSGYAKVWTPPVADAPEGAFQIPNVPAPTSPSQVAAYQQLPMEINPDWIQRRLNELMPGILQGVPGFNFGG